MYCTAGANAGAGAMRFSNLIVSQASELSINNHTSARPTDRDVCRILRESVSEACVAEQAISMAVVLALGQP